MRHLLCVVMLLVGCGAPLEHKPDDMTGAAGEQQEAGAGSAGTTGEAGAGPAGTGAAGQAPPKITMRLALQNCDSKEVSFAVADRDVLLVQPIAVPAGACTTTCGDDPSTGARCASTFKAPSTAAGYCDAFQGAVLHQDCVCSGSGARGQTLTTFQCVGGERLGLAVVFSDGSTAGIEISCVPADVAAARCP